MSDATTTNPQLDAMGPGDLFNFLLNTKYIPAYQSTLRAETERRADSFADAATFCVCGEELRLMTPRDLLMLDGFDNAFVCGGEPTRSDLQWFLWTLNVLNDGSRSWFNRWRKGRCYGRVSVRGDFDCDVTDVYHYIDRLWLDEPSGDAANLDGAARPTRKPPTTYCLAPLLVNVAGTMGAIDPMSGRLLADTPIPRLLQYQRANSERKTGESDASSFDSLRSRCLEEVNQIMAARRK